MDASRVDSSKITYELDKKVKEMYSDLNKLAYFRYNLLLYKLAMGGQITKRALAEAAGIKENTLYVILDRVEEELRKL